MLYYGKHEMSEVFIDSLKSLKLFIILFALCFIISKKVSKKAFTINNITYLLLIIFYLTTSILKAYILSNLPNHDLRKDLCGLEYSIIQVIIAYHIPIIYTIILSAAKLDKELILRKKSKDMSEKNNLES